MAIWPYSIGIRSTAVRGLCGALLLPLCAACAALVRAFLKRAPRPQGRRMASSPSRDLTSEADDVSMGQTHVRRARALLSANIEQFTVQPWTPHLACRVALRACAPEMSSTLRVLGRNQSFLGAPGLHDTMDQGKGSTCCAYAFGTALRANVQAKFAINLESQTVIDRVKMLCGTYNTSTFDAVRSRSHENAGVLCAAALTLPPSPAS